MSSLLRCVETKGVGPGMTLAWPGWKQSDIAVEVDTGRLETSRFKKCYANCVLLYFPSTEFKSAFNVYWHGGGPAGLSCKELSIWEFPFLRGVCWQGWTSVWYCEKGMPQKDTLDNLRTPVCFRILSSSFTSISPQRMRSSLVVRASDCQCTRCNGPGFDPSIRRHSGIWGAADEAVLNTVRKKKKIPQKNI